LRSGSVHGREHRGDRDRSHHPVIAADGIQGQERNLLRSDFPKRAPHATGSDEAPARE